MIIDISGPAIRGLSRASIGAFVAESLSALRRARAVRSPVDEVSISFVTDAEMTSLNRRWRRKNKTTDVLTFPAGEDASSPGLLGDIVISLDQARRQARQQRHSLAVEIRYLLLHGVIHALGYDHEADAGEMNALELKIRERVGL